MTDIKRSSFSSLFYNWCKSLLYKTYIHPGDVIVNLQSGYMTDIHKILEQRPKSILNLDSNLKIVENGLKYSRESCLDNVNWYLGDMRDSKTFDILAEKKILYIPRSVHCFIIPDSYYFSYLCTDKEVVLSIFEWIHKLLVPGGYLIGVITGPCGIKMDEKSDTFLSVHQTFLLSLLEGRADARPFDPSTAVSIETRREDDKKLVKQGGRGRATCKHMLAPFALVRIQGFAELYKLYNNQVLNREERESMFSNSLFVLQKI